MDRKKALKSGIIAVTLLVAAILTQQLEVQANYTDNVNDNDNEEMPYCDKVDPKLVSQNAIDSKKQQLMRIL